MGRLIAGRTGFRSIDRGHRFPRFREYAIVRRYKRAGNMNLKLWIGAAGLALCLFVQPVAAGDFEDALTASKNGDYETALSLLRPLADHGDINSQAWLAYMYYEGQGVPQDYGEAVNLFRKAAEQGNSFAQFNPCDAV